MRRAMCTSACEYTDAEKAFLEDEAFASNAQFCQQCGQCRDDCPVGVDVPTLMRAHMYALQYGNLELARSTLSSVGPGTGLDACAACDMCKAACRHDVNIGAKIAQLKAASAYIAV